jgi:tetratricopeptide (TPR) repeat protein
MSEFFITREQAENDLLAAAAFIGERIKSGDGHASAMNAVLPLYLEKGEVDLSAEMANSVNDPYSRDRLVMMVAEKCAEIDDIDYAMQLVDAIEDVGLQAQATERVALSLAEKGDIEAALEIADSMAHPDFVQAGVAAKEAETDDDAAQATVEDIEFASARVSAAQHIASTLIHDEKYEDAVPWLERGVESAADIEHDEEKIRSLCEIGSLFADAKRNDKAIETIDAARGFAVQLENSLRDFFLGNCALGFLAAGSSELGEQTLDLINDKTQMASALVGFARDSWKKEEKDEAVDTLEEAYAILKSQREIEIRDSKSRNHLLTVLAVQFAGFGKTERGVEIAHENPDPAEETDALSQIGQVLMAQKEDDLARQTINEIAEDADRLFALIGLADAKNKLGDAEMSMVLLNEAKSLSETVPQLVSRSAALNELAIRFAEQGVPEIAREMCIENLSVILDVKDLSSKAALLANLSIVSERADLDIAKYGKDALAQILRFS